MTKKLCGFFLFIILVWTSSPAQNSGLLFLTIDPGGRATGMGGAYVAEASDVTAIYYNPAGLAFADTSRKQVFFSFNNWIPMLKDIYQAYVAYGQHIPGWGNFGASLTYMSYGEQQRTGPGGEEWYIFRSNEYALTPLSFGTKIVENLGVGINFKLIRSDLFPGDDITPEAAASGYAVEFGVLQKDLFAKRDSSGNIVSALAIGGVLQNIGPNVSYVLQGEKKDPLPQQLKLGAVYKVRQPIRGEEDKFNELLFLFDVKKPLIGVFRAGDDAPNPIQALFSSWTDEPWDVELRRLEEYLGVEYWYASWIGLRMGYRAIWKSGVWALEIPPSTFTFGATLNYPAGNNKYILDLSYMPASGIIADTYRFSLLIDF